jgi:quercetin dioxygenase-like cupin family protein
MEDISRRSAFALGVLAAATPALLPTSAAARTYGPEEGKELAPGVRIINIGKSESTIPAYKTIEMADVVFQPGKSTPEMPMDSDMVCHVPQGELLIKKGAKQFTVKEGGVYSCTKSETEGATNTGSTVAVMRVIFLRGA